MRVKVERFVPGRSDRVVQLHSAARRPYFE
jgi:hypothetical protein